MKVLISILSFLFFFNLYAAKKGTSLTQVFPPGEYESMQLEFCSSGKLEITPTGDLRLGQSINFSAIGKPMEVEKSPKGFPPCVTKHKTTFDSKLKIVQEKSETICKDSSNNSVASAVLKRLGNKLLYVGVEKLTVKHKKVTRKVRCEFIKK